MEFRISFFFLRRNQNVKSSIGETNSIRTDHQHEQTSFDEIVCGVGSRQDTIGLYTKVRISDKPLLCFSSFCYFCLFLFFSWSYCFRWVCVSLMADDSAFTHIGAKIIISTLHVLHFVLHCGSSVGCWSDDFHSPHAMRWITADERFFSLCYTIGERLRIREIDSSFVFPLDAVRANIANETKKKKKTTETIYIKILDAVHALARPHFSSIYHWIYWNRCVHTANIRENGVCECVFGLYLYVRPTYVCNDDLRCEAGRRRRCQASVKYFVHFSSRRVHFSNRRSFCFSSLFFPCN